MRVTTQITWRCDIRCAHCNQDHLRVDLDYALFERFLMWVEKNVGLEEIGITGGEPFLKRETIEKISIFSKNHHLPFSVITNGFWAKSYSEVKHQLSKLEGNGLRLVTISTDKYHQAHVPIENLLIVLQVCQELGLQSHIYSTLDHSNASDNDKTINFLACISQVQPYVEVSLRYSIPVGHSLLNGIGVNSGFEINELNLTCPQKNQMTIWPNGDVLPCCSAGTHKNLIIGNIASDSPQEIYDRYRTDEILCLIRRYDVGALMSVLSEEQRGVISSKKYISVCHLCMEINSRVDCRSHIKKKLVSEFDPLSIIFSV